MVILNGDQQDSTLAILADSMQNLLKSNVMTKPSIFIKSKTTIVEHIEAIDKFAKCVKAETDLEKVLLLWDTLPEETRNEVIFDEDYAANSEKYGWLTEKLKRMFPVDSNKVVDLINLNQLKQDGRPISEYVSIVKQACAKRKSNFNNAELQRFAVKIFVAGLDDPLFKRSLKQLGPKNIDEAYKEIKNIKSENNNYNCRKIESTQNKCHNCSENYKTLTNKIDYLQRLIVNMQKSVFNLTQNSTRLPQRQNNNFISKQKPHNSDIKCYNCGRTGHIQRNCR